MWKSWRYFRNSWDQHNALPQSPLSYRPQNHSQKHLYQAPNPSGETSILDKRLWGVDSSVHLVNFPNVCSPSLLKIFHISNGILLNFHLMLLIIILQDTHRNCCNFYSFFYILLMIAVFLVSLGSINDIPWNILHCLCIDQCYVKVHLDKKVKTLSCNAIRVSTLLHPSDVKSVAQNSSHEMDFSWKTQILLSLLKSKVYQLRQIFGVLFQT